MTAANTEKRNEALGLKDVFASTPAIKRIAQFYCFIIQDGSCDLSILTKMESIGPSQEIPLPAGKPMAEPNENVVQVGDWWIVEYDDELCRGRG